MNKAKQEAVREALVALVKSGTMDAYPKWYEVCCKGADLQAVIPGTAPPEYEPLGTVKEIIERYE